MCNGLLSLFIIVFSSQIFANSICEGIRLKLPATYDKSMNLQPYSQTDWSSRIARTSFWRTTIFTVDKNLTNNGLFIPAITKIWKTDTLSKSLIEVSANSILSNCQNGINCWGSKRVSYDREFELIDFYDITNEKALTLKDLGNDKFAIFGQSYIAVFSPVTTDQIQSKPLQKDLKFYLWQAPLGMIEETAELFYTYPKPLPQKLGPLKHDLKKVRKVYIDESFPRQFEAALLSGLNEWNKALGINFYILDGWRKLDPLACIASDESLCIFWDGPPTLAWASFAAISTPSFNPLSGDILGGAITFINQVKEDDLSQTPQSILNTYNNNQIDIQTAAAFLMKRKLFSTYRHPEPEKLVKAIFIHELGHDFGMPHYFMGSINTSKDTLFDTVMDYPPFPVFGKMDHLGIRDLAKLDAIYDNGFFVGEPECKNVHVMSNPVCQPGDLGEPVVWNYFLAQSNPEWIFADLPSAGGLNFGSVSKIIDRLYLFLRPSPAVTSSQQVMAHQILCSRPDKYDDVAKYIKEKFSDNLICSSQIPFSN